MLIKFLCELEYTLTSTSMSRKFSTIEISDVVDQNGAARYGFEDVGAPVNDNSTIAPWLEEPVRIDYLVWRPSPRCLIRI